MTDQKIQELRKMIAESDNIVFFGGAGVSTESNIPDFRSSTGLYTTSDNKKHPPEYMLSHTCYVKDTVDFYKYYRENILYPEAKPNAAHYALARLEEVGKLKGVITQNIDGLHQMAGSKKVIELHGSVYENYCDRCGKSDFSMDYIYHSKDPIPKCDREGCGGTVRPNVVLYEESLNMNALEQAISLIARADVLIVGGTSLVVYPAAGLINYYRGNKLVLINKSKTSQDSFAKLVIHDSIGKVLQEATEGI